MTLTDDVTMLIEKGFPGGGLGVTVGVGVGAADQVVVKVEVFGVRIPLGFGDQAVADQRAELVRMVDAGGGCFRVPISWYYRALIVLAAVQFSGFRPVVLRFRIRADRDFRLIGTDRDFRLIEIIDAVGNDILKCQLSIEVVCPGRDIAVWIGPGPGAFIALDGAVIVGDGCNGIQLGGAVAIQALRTHKVAIDVEQFGALVSGAVGICARDL